MQVTQGRFGQATRIVLTGMITDTAVLSKIAPKWNQKTGMFSDNWSNQIGQWCVEYYNQYGRAPRRAIEAAYGSWSEDRPKGDDTARLVGKFLDSLSDEYAKRKKRLNSSYVVDLAGRHFNRVLLMKLSEAIRGDVDLGKEDQALKRLAGFDLVKIGGDAATDVLQNPEEAPQVFDRNTSPPLIQYPGALGKFFGRSLNRENFVAFMAPEKRGKTFWLMDLAWRGMLARNRVLFLEVGDMTKIQILERFYVRAAGRPMEAGDVRVPTKIEELKGEKKAVRWDTRHYKTGLTANEVKKALRRTMMEKVKSKESFLKLCFYPNNTMTVAGVKALVQQLEKRKWVPDIIVIDYADLLAPAPGYSESRDAVNANWKGLRALSQEYHCLLVTATQANAASYTTDSLGMENFSEDKRKFAHVTGMVGINQNPTDKEEGYVRLNWLVLRDARYSSFRYAYAAGCLDLCHPAMVSWY